MQSRPMHSINSLSQFWVYVERAGLGPAVGLGHSLPAYRRPRGVDGRGSAHPHYQ